MCSLVFNFFFLNMSGKLEIFIQQTDATINLSYVNKIEVLFRKIL